jgi:hypothetical protein
MCLYMYVWAWRKTESMEVYALGTNIVYLNALDWEHIGIESMIFSGNVKPSKIFMNYSKYILPL